MNWTAKIDEEDLIPIWQFHEIFIERDYFHGANGLRKIIFFKYKLKESKIGKILFPNKNFCKFIVFSKKVN